MEILMGICSSKIGATHCIENDLVIRQNRSEYSLDKIQDPLQPSMHFNFQQVSDLGDDQDRFPCFGRVCDKNTIWHSPRTLSSGKHTKNYGQSHFLIGKSTINGPWFNSYGKLPEGIYLVGGFKFIAFRWDADSQPIKFEEFFVILRRFPTWSMDV